MPDPDVSGLAEPFEMEVFQAGDYGPNGDWTDRDLDAIAADYDAATLHEAPVTVDHTKSGPAWGWVDRLRRVGSRLVATIKQMPTAFRELIQQGRYKKRSAELYFKHPKTGRPYLRAVTFLGAQPPEVKGLADVTFTEDDGDVAVVEFEEGGREVKTYTQEQLDAAIKETLDKRGAEQAAEFAEVSKQLEKAKADLARAKEGAGGGDVGDRPAEFAELRGQVDKAKADLAETQKMLAAERQVRLAQTQRSRRAEIVSFCEKLEGEGQLSPALRQNGLVELMESLSDEETIEFGEGENKSKKSQQALFRGVLAAMPAAVPTGEVPRGISSGDGPKGWAEIAAEFAEGRETFESMGLTLEDYAKVNYGVTPPQK